ncbi:ClpX C4-type zinc finger protein [Streptomyces sp. DH12]|uniref:ClpX C4-type zinc finger protein n=1 Tax=Bacillati TaxID=1783272 RepID=UPI0009DB081E|nr:ClpX C4-type zinc finger protein [Eubacterium limosum]
MRKTDEKIKCSFCGKVETEDQRVLVTESRINICEECARKCMKAFENGRGEQID